MRAEIIADFFCHHGELKQYFYNNFCVSIAGVWFRSISPLSSFFTSNGHPSCPCPDLWHWKEAGNNMNMEKKKSNVETVEVRVLTSGGPGLVQAAGWSATTHNSTENCKMSFSTYCLCKPLTSYFCLLSVSVRSNFSDSSPMSHVHSSLALSLNTNHKPGPVESYLLFMMLSNVCLTYLSFSSFRWSMVRGFLRSARIFFFFSLSVCFLAPFLLSLCFKEIHLSSS